MRNVLIFLSLALILLVGLVVNMPLGFPLAMANLKAQGIQYATAEGTIWSGRLSGVEAQGQPIGDVLLENKPLALLTGALAYDVQWGGPTGRGAGSISLSSNEVSLSDVRLEQDISGIEGLMNAVRDIGGTVRVRNGALKIRGDQCVSGAADMTSDVLTLAAQSFGRNFGDVTGQLSCEDGDLSIVLNSVSDAGDRVDVEADVALNGVSQVNAKVLTNDDELAIVLAQLEFLKEDGIWTYSSIRGIGQQ